VSAYSPLGGSPKNPSKGEKSPSVHTNQTLAGIAERHKCSAAQVALKYQLTKGVAIIPKSSKQERMIENLKAAEVNLTSEDIADIDKLDTNTRFCDIFKDHEHYPFKEEF